MTKLFSEEDATEVVLARHAQLKDARFKQIMDCLVTHLHEAVRELEPTQEEWAAAVDFLTKTGQISDAKRHEFVLLSDVLGVSMLINTINNRKTDGATESTVLGPFHVEGAPDKSWGGTLSDIPEDATPLVVSGRVLDADGRPIAGAALDVWQTDGEGFYDIQHEDGPEMDYRAVFRTDDQGRYCFKTVRPVSYPIPDDGPVGRMLRSLGRHPYRPAHIHVILSAEGCVPVTTHLFMAGDPYLESDTVFGVKASLVVEPVLIEDPAQHPELDMTRPFEHIMYDFVLLPSET